MVSVIKVYEAVRDLCNKDQKGFVSPSVFNRFASLAQDNIFNEMFNELKLASKLRQSGSDAGRDKSAYKMIEEDLSHYLGRAVLNVAGEEPDEVVGYDEASSEFIYSPVEEVAIFPVPSFVHRIVSMSVNDTNTSVEIIYDAEKSKRVLNSNLSAPTEEFPVALVVDRNIEIFPQTISSDIDLLYYRKPASFSPSGVLDLGDSPSYSSLSISDGFVIADQDNCYDFDLPSHYFPEVVAEIARMIGVRLRDDVISQYGVAETTNK